MVFLGLVLLCILLQICSGDTQYQIGAGMADCTGPAAGVNMMGYAKPDQTTSGIHLRQRSRAFIIQDDHKRIVFVSVDSGMISQLVKQEVVSRLRSKYGSIYNDENICLSGTHTHSGPAGFHQYVLFEVTSLGFVKEAFQALVDGIVLSIERALNSITTGTISVTEDKLMDSNINRSPTAYLHNPAYERSRYADNVDKQFVHLRFNDVHGNPLGVLNWFAVHGTSMNNTNTLISGDNKGYASLLFENKMNPEKMPGQGDFVAAFAQSNLGDVSPNTKGPHCLDTGLPCDAITATCNGNVETCVAFGPGDDMTESTEIIGRRQFEKSKTLFTQPGKRLTGPVDYRHQYLDMTKQEIKLPNGSKVQTCKPAMGFSFAAGTTDGPGAFSFKQSDTSGNEFWKLLRDVLKKPSTELEICHRPKPILLATGEMKLPYKWQPEIVDIQIFRIGQFIILAVPGEFTTMSGRRLRELVNKTLHENGFPSDSKIVIAGLSNSYSDYITTYEEYQAQRYEGASTIFGPHTLEAYLQAFKNISIALVKGLPVSTGPSPPNLRSRQITLLPPVVYDSTPPFTHFGDVLKQVNNEYNPGSTVSVEFRSGHPRNDLQHEGSFLTVEQQQTDHSWKTIAVDGSWETRFIWKRTNELLGYSKVILEWDIPEKQEIGTYRIRHNGHYKSFFGGKIKAYSGVSTEFEVHKQSIETGKDHHVFHHIKNFIKGVFRL